jgi:hypothetical protein
MYGHTEEDHTSFGEESSMTLLLTSTRPSTKHGSRVIGMHRGHHMIIILLFYVHLVEYDRYIPFHSIIILQVLHSTLSPTSISEFIIEDHKSTERWSYNPYSGIDTPTQAIVKDSQHKNKNEARDCATETKFGFHPNSSRRELFVYRITAWRTDHSRGGSRAARIQTTKKVEWGTHANEGLMQNAAAAKNCGRTKEFETTLATTTFFVSILKQVIALW